MLIGTKNPRLCGDFINGQAGILKRPFLFA
jgi:hypothetical protein